MDLLLTHGYFLSEDAAEQRVMKPYPPLGILSIASYLKSRGYSVGVFDTTFARQSDFRSCLAAKRPPVVGISANLMTKLTVLEQIRWAKAAGSRVVVGGPDVPEYAREYLEHGADVAVIGEGEETMAELLPALASGRALEGVRGIAFRNGDGKIVRSPQRPLIPELDSLPLPDRAMIDIPKYLSTWRDRHGYGSVSLICARGCPFTCTWCSRSVFGETHRRRSPSGVADEIALIREQYSPDMLWFADDVFTINHKWFYEFHAEMKRRGFRIPFECITRADRLTGDILEKMAELGAARIWYGSESGSQRILDAMQRRVSVDEIRSAAALARRYGIESGLFVMIGYPGEEISDIEETVEHLKRTGADHFLTTVAYPIRGTEFYRSVEGRIIPPPSWSSGTDRNLRISGRYSDRFYWFANRYIANEVKAFRMKQNGAAGMAKIAPALAKAKLARLGMELTKEQRS